MILLPQPYWAVKTTKEKGRGIFARKDILPGTVIGDYLGKIIKRKDDDGDTGLYSMEYGDYLVLPDKKSIGLHVINHSCMPTSGIYPYRDHNLYVSLRKIFAGEEITVSYMIEPNDEENEYPCYCDSLYCTGSMVTNRKTAEKLGEWTEREVAKYFKDFPGKPGDSLEKLAEYPSDLPDKTLFNLFGNTSKSPEVIPGDSMLSLAEMRKRIRESGRTLIFEHLNIRVLGVMDTMFLGTPITQK